MVSQKSVQLSSLTTLTTSKQGCSNLGNPTPGDVEKRAPNKAHQFQVGKSLSPNDFSRNFWALDKHCRHPLNTLKSWFTPLMILMVLSTTARASSSKQFWEDPTIRSKKLKFMNKVKECIQTNTHNKQQMIDQIEYWKESMPEADRPEKLRKSASSKEIARIAFQCCTAHYKAQKETRKQPKRYGPREMQRLEAEVKALLIDQIENTKNAIIDDGATFEERAKKSATIPSRHELEQKTNEELSKIATQCYLAYLRNGGEIMCLNQQDRKNGEGKTFDFRKALSEAKKAAGARASSRSE